jgi:bacillithiol system protein YtxJ
MKTITTEQELGELVAQSAERPVLIFKHSNACPVSARAHDEVQRFVGEADGGDFAFGMVVVQEARPVSRAIEEQLGLRHESPQAIVVRDGKVVWNASHWNVTRDALGKALGGS